VNNNIARASDLQTKENENPKDLEKVDKMPPIRWLAVRVKRSCSFVFISLFAAFVLISSFSYLSNIQSKPVTNTTNSQSIRHKQKGPNLEEQGFDSKAPITVVIGTDVKNNKTSKKSEKYEDKKYQNKNLNYNVHTFYYAWYGSPEFDGQWWHWNHEYIPPWDKNDHKKYPTGAHVPPKDVGANFYPELGPYSSKDPKVLDKHLQMMADAKIGVISISWYPPGQADEHGPPSDGAVPVLLDIALKYGLKICLHVEPYEGRSVANFRKHLRYVHETYGSHPAYYKIKKGSQNLPLFYIYDSYRITPEDWQRIFSNRGDLSIRNSELDGVFIGLMVEYKHRFDIKKAGFDGFYTYFASNGFSYGSSWKNWKSLANYAFKSSLIFIPSVGPGYIDTRVRAWNGKNTQPRRNGMYYETAWRTALNANTKQKLVSITSFNEWHEGTQIEPAVPMQCNNYTYESYQPRSSSFYLELTEKWSMQFANRTLGQS